jgi:hypothetical protein
VFSPLIWPAQNFIFASLNSGNLQTAIALNFAGKAQPKAFMIKICNSQAKPVTSTRGYRSEHERPGLTKAELRFLSRRICAWCDQRLSSDECALNKLRPRAPPPAMGAGFGASIKINKRRKKEVGSALSGKCR